MTSQSENIQDAQRLLKTIRWQTAYNIAIWNKSLETLEQGPQDIIKQINDSYSIIVQMCNAGLPAHDRYERLEDILDKGMP